MTKPKHISEILPGVLEKTCGHSQHETGGFMLELPFPPSQFPQRLAEKIKPNQSNGCWEWQAYRNTRNYGVLRWPTTTLAHRIAWESLYGEIPENMCVLHHCDNPPCVNPSHLFLGTLRDNNQDRDAKGRGNGGQNFNVGERNGSAKLSESDVRAIRKSAETSRDLAKRFGVGRTQITRIRNRTRWASV